ncbi:unnamed protein product, partial [Prorocentrum cordatum]
MVREVLTGVAAARCAADNLVRRLDRELRGAKAVIASLRAQLECGSRGDAAEAEALRREAIARPALVARVRGRRETRAQRQRRNVAWHAEHYPSADPPPQDPTAFCAQPYLPQWARWAALLEELGVAQLAEQGSGEDGAGCTEAVETDAAVLASPPGDAVELMAGGSEVGPEEQGESEGSGVAPVPCGLLGDRRASELGGAVPVGQGCARVKRVSFAPWPDVTALEVGALGGPLGVAGVLRHGPAPQWAGPAWTSQAKAVDLMHLCECERSGISARPRRRLTWRVRFAEGPGREGPVAVGAAAPRPPPVAVVQEPVGGSAIEHAVGMEPLVADSVGCAAGDGHSGSERGFVSFLDDFSVAAVACAAQGPKSGVESLLDWAEARALGIRLGSA